VGDAPATTTTAIPTWLLYVAMGALGVGGLGGAVGAGSRVLDYDDAAEVRAEQRELREAVADLDDRLHAVEAQQRQVSLNVWVLCRSSANPSQCVEPERMP